MLKRLSVKNFALIDTLEFRLGKGFNIITGETGAGKSILLGALGLALGNRADTHALRNPQEKCVVEASFEVNLPSVNAFLQEADLEVWPELILRREILPGGKSRAFINDTPVNLSQMRQLGDLLVDIHSQHETLLMNAADFQLAVVDDFALNGEYLRQYKEIFREYKKDQSLLESLKIREAQSMAERDYLEFLYKELLDAALAEEEQQELEEELDLLTHAEDISLKINQILWSLENDESGVISILSSQSSDFEQISRFSSELGDLSSRFESCLVELKDIRNELEKAAGKIHYDPSRIEVLSARLDLIFRLQKKHRVSSIGELIQIREDIGHKLESMDSLVADIESLEKKILATRQRLQEAAQILSERRKQAIEAMETRLDETLHTLGMPDAATKIIIRTLDDFTPSGIDEATFFFSANIGQEPRPVAKVASGGELSRMMLAIKSLISHKTLIPVIIFDEIDTGVSGGIADRTGKVMKQMAQGMQVIAITHIPQIAALGDHHFMVYKETAQDQTTRSTIRRLSEEERIEAIAGMISNQQITEASREAAKQLLSSVVKKG